MAAAEEVVTRNTPHSQDLIVPSQGQTAAVARGLDQGPRTINEGDTFRDHDPVKSQRR